jgi:hypothetical protein
MRYSLGFVSLMACCLVVVPPAPLARAESKVANESSFLPMWKLFRTNESKQQFVAGYLSGFRDAARVTDVAIAYGKDNPANVMSGLERIKDIYAMEGLTAESMVRALDEFFAEPEGKDATLSQAILAARSRLGR